MTRATASMGSVAIAASAPRVMATATPTAALAALAATALAGAAVVAVAAAIPGLGPTAVDGRLAVSGDGARLVVSLPASAWHGIDDDGDGRLSETELRTHAGALADQARARVQLLDAAGPLPLERLAFAPAGGGRRVRVQGRFALALPDAPLRLRVAAFGTGAVTPPPAVTITIVDGSGSRRRVFTPAADVQPLAPTARERWSRAWRRAVSSVREAAAAPISDRAAGAAPVPAGPSRPARHG